MSDAVPVLGGVWSSAIAGGIAALISAGELYEHLPRSRLNLLLRWQALLYITVNIGFAVAALQLLRYLTVPNSRTAELEQIALAGVSARLVLSRATGIRSRKGKPGSGRDEAAGTGSDAGGTIFDNVLRRIIDDLDGGEQRRITRLLAALSGVNFEALSRAYIPIVVAQVLQPLGEKKQKEFNEGLGEINQRSVLDPDGARNQLILLIVSFSGERWFRDAIEVFAAQDPEQRDLAKFVRRGLDQPVPFWRPFRARDRRNYLKRPSARP